MKNAPQPFGAKLINLADHRKIDDVQVRLQTADLLEEGLRLIRILECGDDVAILMMANEIRNERANNKCPKPSRLIFHHARQIVDIVREG